MKAPESWSRLRAVSPVVSTVLLVAVVAIISSIISVFALGLADSVDADAPVITVSHSIVPDGGDPLIAVTHEGGDDVETDHLSVVGSTPVDIGSRTVANDDYASRQEKFNEGSDQVGAGDYWTAGETAYFDPDGVVDGVTLRFVWSEQPTQNVNPTTPNGETTFIIAELTVDA